MEDARILVVDDEPEVASVIVDVLAQEGHQVHSTSDSREASTLLESTAFDVIVSDIVMPHLDGLQLLEMARRLNPNVQVVLVTGYATRDIALEALAKGAAGFVEKPFHTEQLLQAVREALRRWRVRRTQSGSG